MVLRAMATRECGIQHLRQINISGEVRITALEKSLIEVIRRHEALRATFSSLDGFPSQNIASPEQIRIILVDLTALPDIEREEEARQIAVANRVAHSISNTAPCFAQPY